MRIRLSVVYLLVVKTEKKNIKLRLEIISIGFCSKLGNWVITQYLNQK